MVDIRRTTQTTFFSHQEKMECAKRSWEVQQLQKLKTEEEDQLFVEGEEDLFTYTREDAYNMVGRCTVWNHPSISNETAAYFCIHFINLTHEICG